MRLPHGPVTLTRASTFAEEPVMARSPRGATAAAVAAARNEARRRTRPDWKRPRRSCWTVPSTTASTSRGDRHMTETEAHRPMGKTNTARLAFVVPTRRIIPTVKRLPPDVGAVCARGTGSLCMTMMAEPHSTGNTSPRTRNWIGVHVHTRDPKDQRGLRPQDAGKLQSGRDMDGQEYSEPGEWYRM